MISEICDHLNVSVNEVWLGTDGKRYSVCDNGYLWYVEYPDCPYQQDDISRVLRGEVRPEQGNRIQERIQHMRNLIQFMPDGTFFWVVNGMWYGKVFEHQGQRFIMTTKNYFPIATDYVADIRILDKYESLSNEAKSALSSINQRIAELKRECTDD